jgi:hypothetical protein
MGDGQSNITNACTVPYNDCCARNFLIDKDLSADKNANTVMTLNVPTTTSNVDRPCSATGQTKTNNGKPSQLEVKTASSTSST